jgi:hypothetical protein
MISEQAKQSIAQIFLQAAQSRLRPYDEAELAITQMDARRTHDMLAPHALVLTISSMTFRLMFVLHFADDSATREAYLGADKNRDLAEVLMEQVNLCCGSINQQLVAHFPDLGMSTPYALSSRCIDFLGELDPDQIWSYALHAGEAARLDVTLCLCAQKDVDFTASAEAMQEEGELELF